MISFVRGHRRTLGLSLVVAFLGLVGITDILGIHALDEFFNVVVSALCFGLIGLGVVKAFIVCIANDACDRESEVE